MGNSGNQFDNITETRGSGKGKRGIEERKRKKVEKVGQEKGGKAEKEKTGTRGKRIDIEIM